MPATQSASAGRGPIGLILHLGEVGMRKRFTLGGTLRGAASPERTDPARCSRLHETRDRAHIGYVPAGVVARANVSDALFFSRA